MKCALFSISFLFLFLFGASAQKKVIDTSDFRKWEFVINPIISCDGKFVAYNIANRPNGGTTTVVKSVNGTNEKHYGSAYSPSFTDDGSFFVTKSENAINILNLRSFHEETIIGAQKYSFLTRGKGSWICYVVHDSSGRKVVLRNLISETSNTYDNAFDFITNGSNQFIYLKRQVDSNIYSISKSEFGRREMKEIYRGQEPVDWLLSKNEDQLIFLTETKEGNRKAMWHYNHANMTDARILEPEFVNSSVEIRSLERFSEDGTMVFLKLDRAASIEKNHDFVGVNIMTSSDSRLDEYRNGHESQNPDGFLGVFYLKNNKILQMQYDHERLSYVGSPYSQPVFDHPNDKAQLAQKTIGQWGEWNWNEKSMPSKILLDYEHGTRKVVTEPGDRNSISYMLSPSGKWIVYFDAEKQAYFSYNAWDGVRRNITPGISTNWTSYDNDDIPFSKYTNIGLGGFDLDGETVYLYDQYDIFRADLNGVNPPVNITNGFGKANNIVFRFAFSPEEWSKYRVLLTAFNRKTKEDGFFRLDLKRGSLEKLIMEDAIYSGPEQSKYFSRVMPIKAKNAEVYLVQRMSSKMAPNIYVTKDFRSFKIVSEVFTEKKFNWLTTELITFKTRDGKVAQGIMYKPENFDPNRKYPIIFHYYEKVSECLNMYIRPDVSNGPLNIPYFVSNGYIVFTPDIHFTIGHPGESALNTVLGVVDTLIRRPYIDSLKMGLQGHSFGGFQTNYIISHNNQFAAACSAAGFTNFVSAYGSVVGPGYTRQGQYELYRDRIGATLWERPDLYLENSPVMKIDRINTPLLIMHNQDDDDVPVTQGNELFTGLRRLGKVAYMLQYDGEGHSVIGAAAKDYSKRMLDFFDHYLKGVEPVAWLKKKPLKRLSVSLGMNNK